MRRLDKHAFKPCTAAGTSEHNSMSHGDCCGLPASAPVHQVGESEVCGHGVLKEKCDYCTGATLPATMKQVNEARELPERMGAPERIFIQHYDDYAGIYHRGIGNYYIDGNDNFDKVEYVRCTPPAVHQGEQDSDSGNAAQPSSGVAAESERQAESNAAVPSSRECPCKGTGDEWAYDCTECFGTGLLPFVHYAADATGRPCCIEPNPTTTKDSAKVTCPHCLNVFQSRQNMDMGDWLK